MLTYLRMDAGRWNYDAGVSSEEAYTLAREAGMKALALDPENVQALKALSFIARYTGQYQHAQDLARRALQANPYDPDTLAQLGWRLAVRGNFEEGIPYMRRAIERSINPAPWYFHMIAIDHLMRGDYPAMLEAAERAAADGSSISQSLLAIAYGGLGKSTEAQKALASMAQKWPLLGEDPAAAYGVHHVTDEISHAIVNGLQQAGWKTPKH
jgi:tetratricopeptide (TPR) repeat protein